MMNRLIHQKSRYLQQHATNPVQWYPWGEEAFSKAREEDKPVLLSIGYSSCHWCHVMAHESFEDPQIASLLNESFIAVKVDKEEYPDVDSFYMEYLSRLTGSGGWPLNVFVNPHGAPFFGLTYLPKSQFQKVLEKVRQEYPRMEQLHERELTESIYLHSLDDHEIREVLENLDLPAPHEHAGPQFPQPLYSAYLLEKGRERDVKKILQDVVTKGLFDHIEGGWFRYTVDPQWKVPHFEKMLYDQAGLLYFCAQAYTADKRLCDYAIRAATRWIEEHMRLPSGLYASATDADTEDGEGFYYTIPKTANDDVRSLFRLDEAGDHEGRLVPWMNFDYFDERPDVCEVIREKYELDRKKLIPPGIDDKAVVAWNAFLGFAYVRCHERLGDPMFLVLADRLYENIARFRESDDLPHIVYGEDAVRDDHEYLSDYSAYLLFTAELSRYRDGLREETEGLIETIKSKFLHPNWLFHTTERVYESLTLWQDTPFPSGGSILLNALLTLESDETVRFMNACTGIADIARENPMFFAYWLSAFSHYYRE